MVKLGPSHKFHNLDLGLFTCHSSCGGFFYFNISCLFYLEIGQLSQFYFGKRALVEIVSLFLMLENVSPSVESFLYYFSVVYFHFSLFKSIFSPHDPSPLPHAIKKRRSIWLPSVYSLCNLMQLYPSWIGKKKSKL